MKTKAEASQAPELYDPPLGEGEPLIMPPLLPGILVPGGATSITFSAKFLFQAIAPSRRLFWGAAGPVELTETGGGYEARPLNPAGATSTFEKFVRFRKLGKDGASYPTVISEALAKQYLSSSECRELLPPLKGILRCPILVERDGGVQLVGSGYDPGTGFYVAAAANPEPVTLPEAVEFLKGLLQDFNFVTPSDYSRALASLLTPALKLGGIIKGPVPVEVAEANDSQAGKTYRQKVLAALYNHELAVVTKKAGGVGSLEETFSEHLIRGRVFIQFDNLRGRLDSQMLESFLTSSGEFTARVPYQGNVTVDPGNFIILITSNGFEATKDLTNRASIVRIRKQASRTYPLDDAGDDLLRFTFKHQPLLYGAVTAVVQEWFRQGRPRTGELRHDFKEWCQSLDWIVQYLFGAAPLMDGHGEAKIRVASPQLTFVRALATQLEQGHQLGRPMSASDLADVCVENEVEIPGMQMDGMKAEDARKVLGKIFNRVFGDQVEIVCEQYRIVRTEQLGRTEAGNPQTLKRYTFTLAVGAGVPSVRGAGQNPDPVCRR